MPTTTTELPTTTETTTEKESTTTTTTAATTTPAQTTTTAATTTTTETPTTTTTEVPTTTTTTETPTTTTTRETPSTTTESLPTTTDTPTTTTTELPTTTTEAPTTTTTEAPTTTTTLAPTTTTTEITTTTEPTTTTTLFPTTTTLAPTTPGPRTGVFYNETGDYYFPNLIRNATVVDESADVKITNGPIGFGWAIDLDSNSDDPRQCLKMKVTPWNAQDDLCWFNPSNCYKGFSISIWEKITFNRNDTQNRFIFSTGADSDGSQGVTLYFKGIYILSLISTGEEMWNLTVPGPVRNNTWSQVGLLWSKETGLEMFVNNVSVGHVKYPDKVDPAQLRGQPMELTVGCRKNQDGIYTDFAYGEYDELTAWMWALEDEQRSYFLGGYDPDSNCDPELHPLNCETNLEKIFKNMDNVDMVHPVALAESLDHLKMLSEVEKDPAGSDKEQDKNAETRNKEEIKIFVAIIDKLITNTWDEPNNLNVGDLQNMLAVQDLASNLLDEKYYEGWQNLQNEGLTSVGFVNRVTEYVIQKMSQTDIGKEPMMIEKNSKNIYSDLRKSTLYDILGEDEPISFPGAQRNEENKESKRKKREAEETDNETEDESKVQVVITKELYGDVNKFEKVSLVGSSYKSLDRLSPLWNKRTGNFTTLIFIDSEIVTVRSDPNASSAALEKEPVMVKMKHKRKAKATGRKLLADKELEENGEIRNRECVRWDPNLQAKGSRVKGGWTPDACSIANTSAEESTCECTMLGTYAILSKIRQPFDIPPEDEWVKICKWIGFGLSTVLLVLYIFVIIIRKKLHEPFHVIRLNLAVAALGALVSFCLSGFLYDDENTCRILSVTIHLFYTAVGTWLIAEAHALFSALVNGSIGGKFTLYFMIGWVTPAGMVGGCFTVIVDYGYDYRCLVGPTASMRWLLVSPILISSVVAFTFSLLTCINYGTPAIKKTVVVNELSSATRSSFIVILLFFSTWVCGVFALIDLGFDGGEIPAFNPIFQILNSCLGIFIVALIGLGSKHFRYCLCHAGRSTTQTKALNLDPFDVHDKAKISNMKKIYTAN